jgi:hypothetical protein
MSLQPLKQVLNSHNLVAETKGRRVEVSRKNNPSALSRWFQVRDLLAELNFEHLIQTVSTPFLKERRGRL